MRARTGPPKEAAILQEPAVAVKPPLGLIRDFTFDANAPFPHTIDLKSYGTRLFVDAARVLALANGIGGSLATRHTAGTLILERG